MWQQHSKRAVHTVYQCCGWKCSTLSPECSNIAICSLLVRPCGDLNGCPALVYLHVKQLLKMYFNSDSECRKKDNDF